MPPILSEKSEGSCGVRARRERRWRHAMVADRCLPLSVRPQPQGQRRRGLDVTVQALIAAAIISPIGKGTPLPTAR